MAKRKKKQASSRCCSGPNPRTAPRDGLCLSPDECASAMKALSDPNRIRIIRALIGGPLSVGQIAEKTDLSVHRVSHHLGRMRSAGLVDAKREGRMIIYRIHPRIATEGGLDLGCSCILFRALP